MQRRMVLRRGSSCNSSLQCLPDPLCLQHCLLMVKGRPHDNSFIFWSSGSFTLLIPIGVLPLEQVPGYQGISRFRFFTLHAVHLGIRKELEHHVSAFSGQEPLAPKSNKIFLTGVWVKTPLFCQFDCFFNFLLKILSQRSIVVGLQRKAIFNLVLRQSCNKYGLKYLV